MTAFNPIPPAQAAEQLRLADIPHPEQMLADFASADLLRTYARVTEIIHAGGRRSVVRDAAIPCELWRRIIAEGKAAEVWTTGTVRLDGSPHLGTPTVTLVGVRINADDVNGAARQHGKTLPEPPVSHSVPSKASARSKASAAHEKEQLTLLPALVAKAEVAVDDHVEAIPSNQATVQPGSSASPKPKRVDMPDPDALWITVNQTMALTNLGRTKVNELMNDGEFVKKKVGRRTLIERASIDRYMAAN